MSGSFSSSRVQPPQGNRASGASRTKTARSRMFAPASWLFVAVAILLVGVLTYYLTLTTRPEISQISPDPNSSEIPGVVELEALVTSQREIDDAELQIDGETVTPELEEQGDNQWRVFHEQIFERGERAIVLRVTDSSGRTAEHSWSFEAAGDLIDPRLALMSPPSDTQVAPGQNGVVIQSTTFADIDEVEVTFDGETVTTRVEEIEEGSEYTNDDEMQIYDWEIRAETWLEDGIVPVAARVTDIHGASTEAEWQIEVADDRNSAGARYFNDTGEYAIEPFLTFWSENDGETTVGDPIGPPIAEGDSEVHQYFRYARLERDTEGVVHRGLIGRELFGAPETPPDRPPGENARLFDPTGHYIQGTIREFWEDHGELSTFGYPLSQEFETDEGYAQYFERALIEVIVLGNQEIVELAPLGEQLYEDRLQEQPGAESVQDQSEPSDDDEEDDS